MKELEGRCPTEDADGLSRDSLHVGALVRSLLCRLVIRIHLAFCHSLSFPLLWPLTVLGVPVSANDEGGKMRINKRVRRLIHVRAGRLQGRLCPQDLLTCNSVISTLGELSHLGLALKCRQN